VKKIWGLFILFLLLLATPTLAQETTPVTETPTATPLPVTLRLFAERETLTLYVATSEPISLNGLEFRVLDDQGNVLTIPLTQGFDVLRLRGGIAESGSCLSYRLAGSVLPLPTVCTRRNLIFQRDVSRADIFWYDFVLNQPRTIVVVGSGLAVTGATCAPNIPDCTVQWYIPPTPTPTPTLAENLSGIQSEPTLTPTPPTPPANLVNLPVLALTARCDGNSAMFYISNNGKSLTFDVPWSGFINDHYYTSGTIRPMIGGLWNYFFWRFDSVDGAETSIELIPTIGVTFENEGKVAITCPQ
jgi:hypothetical protein